MLAIPDFIVLIFLDIAMIVVVVLAWFAILFTRRYPRGIFEFVQGVIRWHNRGDRVRLRPGHGPIPAVQPLLLSLDIRPPRRDFARMSRDEDSGTA